MPAAQSAWQQPDRFATKPRSREAALRCFETADSRRAPWPWKRCWQTRDPILYDRLRRRHHVQNDLEHQLVERPSVERDPSSDRFEHDHAQRIHVAARVGFTATARLLG